MHSNLLLLLFTTSAAFSPLTPRLGRSRPPRMAGGEDEIAELEAKLASLKAAREADAVALKEMEETEAALEAMKQVQVPDFDFATLSARKKVSGRDDASTTPEGLLSEAWKEGDDEQSGASSGGLPLAQIVGGGILALLIVVFSQVPVGQEGLDTVTYGGKDTRLETPDEIRARYERISGGLEGE